MRILLLNYEYPPLGGGAGVATAALAWRLAARGDVVDVVTSGANSETTVTHREHAPPAPVPATLNVHRVRSSRKGMYQAGIAGAAGYLLRAIPVIRRLGGGRVYDLVHVFFSLPTGAILPFARCGGARVVVSLRGSDVPGYDPRLEGAHRALLPLTRWIWRRADRVVAVCESLGRLARRSQPNLRFDVIRNGVDLDLFNPTSPGQEPEAGPLRCLAVSRFVERKALEGLLVAFSLLERGRYRLELVGGGPREPALRRLAARLELGDDIRFAGVLDRAGVAARYREADLFTLAPLEEAFGNVFAEALSCGLPIVGSRVGGIPELVEEGANGLLVPPGDPPALAAAIRRLAEDPRRRKRMARANRAKAETSLSWDRAADLYQELYRELLTKAPARKAPLRPRAPRDGRRQDHEVRAERELSAPAADVPRWGRPDNRPATTGAA